MQRYRTLISILLGLVLLVQGLAVSAAPRAEWSEPAPAKMSATSMADMPCHAQKADKADLAQPCCDASCPDMTTCALGHLACVATESVVFSQMMREALAFTSVRVQARALASPLRPPITLHD